MIVVSFYTKGTVYEQEAIKLMASLQALNLDYDVQEISDKGSWRANVGYKPTFLLEMLNKHKQPIMWTDIDNVFIKRPEILLKTKCDIAFIFVYGIFGLKVPGSSTGVLYFANNKTARDILKDWIVFEKNMDYSLVKIRKTGVDMTTFRQVISKGGYWALRANRLILPISYLRYNFMPEYQNVEAVVDCGHISAGTKREQIRM